MTAAVLHITPPLNRSTITIETDETNSRVSSAFQDQRSYLTKALTLTTVLLNHVWKQLHTFQLSFQDFFYSKDKIFSPLLTFTEHVKEKSSLSLSRQRPILEAPSMLSMLFEANKMVTAITLKRMHDSKIEIDRLEKERTTKREKKLEEWKKQREKSDLSSRCSVALSVFLWISSCLEIFTGLGLIATGNVVGGSLLLAGGLIQLTNLVMMHAGGWDKVAEALPGDNPADKKRVVSWMQIGVGIFAMVLGGGGGALVGKSSLTSGMQTASALSMSGLMFAQAITTIVQYTAQSAVKEAQGNVQQLDTELQILGFRQQDLRNSVEEGMKLNNKCFKLITTAIKKNSQFYSSLLRIQN